MLAHVIRHELRDVCRDGRFRWAAALVGLLLIAALLTGWSYQRHVAAEHASAERLTRDAWLSQSAKDPHTAAHFGAYAFKPRGPLTLFDSGINPYSGVAAWLEAHKQNEFQFRPAQDRASVARLGQMTAAATLQSLVPALIILLAFTKFAGEREDGTLRQLAATGVPARVLAMGKAIGVSAALAMALVPAALVGAAALVLASEPAAAPAAMNQSLLRVGVLVAAYGVYFSVWIALSLCVSALARRSSHALAILLAFWVFNAVIVPRATSDVSRRVSPAPTAFEFAARVHHDTYDGLAVHDYNVKRAAELRERLLRTHNVSRVEDLPINFRGQDYLEREAHSNAVWDKHYTALWTAFDRQTAVHQMAGWFAPLMAMRTLSMALAGADIFHHRDFAVAAESYRRRLVLAMNSALAYGGGSGKLGAYAADASLWSSVEPFAYRQPDITWALGRVGMATGALAAWAVGAWTMLVLAVDLAVRRMGID